MKNKANLKALPPTNPNLMQHTLRAHLQVILWKSANKIEPPEMTHDISKFGWDTKNGVMPVIAQQPIAPTKLLDVISCGCRSEGKACAQKSCKCHSDSLSCTEYCVCRSSENCNNPFTSHIYDDNVDENNESDEDGDIL